MVAKTLKRFGSPAWMRLELSRYRTRDGRTCEVGVGSVGYATCYGSVPARGPHRVDTRTRVEQMAEDHSP
jgi:hypothetical protein